MLVKTEFYLNKQKPEISIILHEEHVPVRGNAMASGDNVFDTEVESEILERLNSGDLWAWCCIEVKAELDEQSASDFLGCCSYKDEKNFKECDYYEDMKTWAIQELNIKLNSLPK